MGGLPALQRLKRIDAEVRAIATSGYAHAPVMADFARNGFAACLSKPYTASELGAVIASVLNPASDQLN